MKIKKYNGNGDKRLTAVFKDGKVIHFGQKNSSTYIDHGDNNKRSAYIARHSKNNENWTKVNPGSLSRFILWGSSTNMNDNIKSYKKKFNV